MFVIEGGAGGRGGGGLFGRLLPTTLPGRLFPPGYRIEPNVGIFTRFTTSVVNEGSRILCVREIYERSLVGSESERSLVEIGDEISMFLSWPLSNGIGFTFGALSSFFRNEAIR